MLNLEKQVEVTSDVLSLDLYEEILRKALRLGYDFPTVSELGNGVDQTRCFLLMRHDIDTSPRNALEMARLEASVGVRSSYFVLLHSPFYNPAAPPHWDALRAIIDLGFEVGLHYDTEFFQRRNIDPLQGVLADAAALEKILGVPIVSVSQHRPASSVFLKELNRHYVDAYNNELITRVRYISDSGFKWRGESLMDILGSEERIHALIHPTSWTFGELDMEGTYRRFEEQSTAELSAEIDSLIESTNQYLSNRERLDRDRKNQYRD
jgi:hypothetical protein